MTNQSSHRESRTGSEEVMDHLRAGVLLEGRYKLLERVPRWVGQRRFRAKDQSTGGECMLIFFAGDVSVENVGDANPVSCLLPVQAKETIRGLTVIRCPWVEADPLTDFVRENGRFSRAATAAFLEKALHVWTQCDQLGMGLPRISPGSLLVHSPTPEGPPEPVLFRTLGSMAEPLDRAFDLMSTALSLLDQAPPGDVSVLSQDFVDLWQEANLGTMDDAGALAFLQKVISALQQPVRTVLPEKRSATYVPPASPIPVVGGSSDAKTKLPEPAREPLRSDRGEKGEPLPETSSSAQVSAPRPEFFWRWVGVPLAILAAGSVVAASLIMINNLLSPLPQPQSELRSLAFRSGGDSAGRSGTDTLSSVMAQARSLQQHGSAQAAAQTWAGLLRQHPDSREVVDNVESFVQTLSGDVENIRLGLRPGLLPLLEQFAEHGISSADYLLARVLWTTEPEVARSRLMQAARGGNQPAILWCREENISLDQE